ncbi:ATP-binding protein [Streptomyces phaeolivaceus]|uniref:ATP-binding protein n=1 Tax=Streptomyces phaeolivaceus TaxID=2653200 RepID=A0A5P8K4H6_9ACTN|nr:ATP-binding protein [Streptomyces phaeolivaceus]QFQ97682.1 ATP-binding protein [Streptomyces phaeolivaceus]
MDCMARKAWDLQFLAEPEEVAALRRIVRLHLGLWGLHHVVDEAQLCVSELVSNVITHVGHGTPATLAVSMHGTYLRIEVYDPDTRALPTLTAADSDSEGGRGMALVDAVTDRWGVQLLADRKMTWCELPTTLTSLNSHRGGPRVTRASEVLDFYGQVKQPSTSNSGRLSATMAEEAAIIVIADLLHWLRAHGRDPDDALDRAQMHFEAEVEAGVLGA